MLLCTVHNSSMQTKEPTWKRVTVSLPREQVEILQQLARAEDRSVSYIVARAVDLALDLHKRSSFFASVHEKIMQSADKNAKSEKVPA
jgi:hypothetical protein